MTALPPPTSPASRYDERRRRFEARRDRLARDAGLLGRWRLATLGGTVGLAFWASELPPGTSRFAALAGALALGVTFSILVRRYGRIERERRRAVTLAALNAEGIARLERRWDDLPATEIAPAGHPYARDLDVYGHASLRRLLGPASPALGERRLASWLLAAAAPGVVARRQEAVREMVPLVELREALAANTRLARPLAADALERLLGWIDRPPTPIEHPTVVWGARLLALAASLTFLAWLRQPGLVAWWTVPVAINVLLTGLVARRAHREFAEAAGSSATLGAVAASFEVVADSRFHSPFLVGSATAIGAGGGGAFAVRRLERLAGLAALRHSPMMHGVINAFTLLDVQVLAAVGRWRQAARSHAPGWFEALADVEAIAALATLAHDQPEWAFPELIVDEASPIVEALSLGHPVLTDAARVANDVTVGPRGTFLFVTGSNMSGKSTLLRAIGANVVLAQAGAPVCARAIRLTPLTVRTSVRVEDSLEAGVSLFMAELLRLRGIVEDARSAGATGVPPVLFLLDEILHGTNSAERQIAARRILLHLLRDGAIGLVTSHDIALADSEALRSLARPVHFTEHFVSAAAGHPARMTFDYLLRPGIATSVNALRLLETMGLG